MICINVTSVSIKSKAEEKGADYGTSDIAIEISSNSNIRFLYRSDYTSLLPEDNIIGVYSLTGIMNQEIINVCIADYTNISDFYDLSFIETTSQHYAIEKRAIISSSYAKQNNLKLDDYISLQIGNIIESFYVSGICNSSSLFYTHDILLDENILTNYTIGLEYYYTSLLVKLADQSTKNEKIILLQNLPSSTVINTIDSQAVYNTNITSDIVTLLILIFVLFILGSVLISYIYQIHINNLYKDILIYKIAGCKPTTITYILLAELLIYALIASTFAIGVSKLITYLIYRSELKLLYIAQDLSPFYLLGIIESFGLIIFGTLKLINNISHKSFLEMREDEKVNKLHPKLLFTFSILSVLITILLFILEEKILLVTVFISLVIYISFLVILYPFFEKYIIHKLFIKKNTLPDLSSKVTLSNKSLRNSNIIAVLACSFLMIFSCLLTYTKNELEDTLDLFKGNIQIQNVIDSSGDVLSTIQNTSDVNSCTPYLAIYNLEYENNSQFTLIACDNFEDLLNCSLLKIENTSLKNNEIIISKHVLQQFNLQIGDELNLVINHTPYTFIISGVHEKPNILIFTSLSSMDIAYNSISISTSNYQETIQEITNRYSLKGFYITSKEAVLKWTINTITDSYQIGIFMFYLIIVITSLCLFNCLYITYTKRYKELSIYKSQGMSFKKFFSYSFINIFLSILSVIIVAFVLFILLVISSASAFKSVHVYLSFMEIFSNNNNLIVALLFILFYITINSICLLRYHYLNYYNTITQ